MTTRINPMTVRQTPTIAEETVKIVNANILLEVAVCVALPLPFSFHATSV